MSDRVSERAMAAARDLRMHLPCSFYGEEINEADEAIARALESFAREYAAEELRRAAGVCGSHAFEPFDKTPTDLQAAFLDGCESCRARIAARADELEKEAGDA